MTCPAFSSLSSAAGSACTGIRAPLSGGWTEWNGQLLYETASRFGSRTAFEARIADQIRAAHARYANSPDDQFSQARLALVYALRSALGFQGREIADARYLVGKSDGIVNRDLWATCDLLVPRRAGGYLRSPEDLARAVLRRVPGHYWQKIFPGAAEKISGLEGV